MRDAVRLAAIHGFLGRPADWETVGRALHPVPLVALDAWRLIDSVPEASWRTIGDALAASLDSVRSSGDGVPLFLVAYSFGARLTLAAHHALSRRPCPVDGVVFVSAHPGLAEADRASRDARQESDEAWAERLEREPAARIWSAWNAQPVLAPSRGHHLQQDLPAPRHVLARAMRAFSLASQPDFRSALRSWPTPWLWVWGEQDEKFARLSQTLRDEGLPGRFAECRGAGHRVPWDNPEEFSALLRGWIDDVSLPEGGKG